MKEWHIAANYNLSKNIILAILLRVKSITGITNKQYPLLHAGGNTNWAFLTCILHPLDVFAYIIVMFIYIVLRQYIMQCTISGYDAAVLVTNSPGNIIHCSVFIAPTGIYWIQLMRFVAPETNMSNHTTLKHRNIGHI